jgi:hypothetical protein
MPIEAGGFRDPRARIQGIGEGFSVRTLTAIVSRSDAQFFLNDKTPPTDPDDD